MVHMTITEEMLISYLDKGMTRSLCQSLNKILLLSVFIQIHSWETVIPRSSFIPIHRGVSSATTIYADLPNFTFLGKI